jgi:hypothetical protein
MEPEREEPCGVTTTLIQVTVTPTNGDKQNFECAVDTHHVVGLGALHRDHSADEQSDSDDSLKELSSAPNSQALDTTEATPKKESNCKNYICS